MTDRPDAPAPPGKKPSSMGKLASIVADRPFASLALIIVLIILVIGMFIYYRGFAGIGPYTGPPRKGAAKFRDGDGGDGGGGAPKKPGHAGGAEGKPDAETEKLIATINAQ
jgi:hypothetical protein